MKTTLSDSFLPEFVYNYNVGILHEAQELHPRCLHQHQEQLKLDKYSNDETDTWLQLSTATHLDETYNIILCSKCNKIYIGEILENTAKFTKHK